MNKSIYLTFSGIAVMLAGIALIFSADIGISTSKIIVPLFFIVGGFLAYLFAQANKQHPLAFPYHSAQAGGLTLFGMLIAFIPQSLSEFLDFVSYFMMAYGLIEIIYAFSALTSNHQLKKEILMSRFLAGFFGLIGSFILLITNLTNESNGIILAGLLVTLGGCAFVAFSVFIKSKDKSSV